jgi:hypothetical protein
MAKHMFRKKLVVEETPDLVAQERLELRRILNRGHRCRDNSAVLIQKTGLWDKKNVQTWYEQTGAQLVQLDQALREITPRVNWPFPPSLASLNLYGFNARFKQVVNAVEIATDTLLDDLNL